MIARLITIAFVLFLSFGVPLLSILTARQEGLEQAPRRLLYLSAVSSQWFLAGLALLLAWGGFLPFRGFRLLSLGAFAFWTMALTLVSLAGLLVVLWLERLGWWPEESRLVYLLLPQTRAETWWCVLLVAPTAGFCEEFLYRGCLLPQLSAWFHSVGWGWAASSVAFGAAHTYQGVNGIVRAALLGAWLALPMVRFGSLLPSIAAHFLIDALALAWIGPATLPARPEQKEA